MKILLSLLIVVLIGGVIQPTHSTERSPVFEYIDVDSFSRNPSIILGDIDDFENLARKYEVDTLFRYRSVKRGPRHVRHGIAFNHTELFIFSGGAYYIFASDNYDTIDDYRTGKYRGFADGRAFYHAERIGIYESTEYESFAGSWFFNYQDYQDAVNTGFSDRDFSVRDIVFPETMGKDLFENEFVRLMARVWIEKGYSIPNTDPLGEEFSMYTMGGDPPFYYLDPAIDLVMDYLIRQIEGQRSFRREFFPYHIEDGEYRFIGAYLTYELFPWDFFENNSEIIDSNVVYYFVRWNGYDDITSYRELLERKSDFSSPRTFYMARRQGYETYAEFNSERQSQRIDAPTTAETVPPPPTPTPARTTGGLRATN